MTRWRGRNTGSEGHRKALAALSPAEFERRRGLGRPAGIGRLSRSAGQVFLKLREIV